MLNKQEELKIVRQFHETASAVFAELEIAIDPKHCTWRSASGEVSGGFIFRLELVDLWKNKPRIQFYYADTRVTWAPDRTATAIAKAIKTKHFAKWEAYQRNNFKTRSEKNSKLESIRQNAASFAEKFGGNFCHAGSRGRHSVYFVKPNKELNYTLRVMEHSGELSLKIEKLTQEQAERVLYFLHHEQNQ